MPGQDTSASPPPAPTGFLLGVSGDSVELDTAGSTAQQGLGGGPPTAY